MKPEQIAELEALAEKATPGPWRAFCGATHTRVYSDADGTVQVAEIAGPSDVGIRPWNGERWEADASLISALVNNLPAILAALKAQQPGEDVVERVARALAASDGLDFDEVCGVDANPDEGYCDSGTCIAAYWEEHDAEEARRLRMHHARAALAAMQEKPND